MSGWCGCGVIVGAVDVGAEGLYLVWRIDRERLSRPSGVTRIGVGRQKGSAKC